MFPHSSKLDCPWPNAGWHVHVSKTKSDTQDTGQVARQEMMDIAKSPIDNFGYSHDKQAPH
jgi:hypothetical protein